MNELKNIGNICISGKRFISNLQPISTETRGYRDPDSCVNLIKSRNFISIYSSRYQLNSFNAY